MDTRDGVAAPARRSSPFRSRKSREGAAALRCQLRTAALGRVAAAEARAAAAEQRAAAAERRAAAADERAAAAVEKASSEEAAAQQRAADAEDRADQCVAAAKQREADAEERGAEAKRRTAQWQRAAAEQAAAGPPEPNTVPLFGRSACVRAYSSFEEMQLPEPLLRGVYSCGLGKVPCAVQQRAVVPIAAGEHVLIQAPAGEDRTMAYAIGVLQRVDWSQRPTLRNPAPQVVVLTRTIGEAAAAENVLSSVGEHLCDDNFCMKLHAPEEHCVPFVAIGTPGDLSRALYRRSISASGVRCVVMDGVDDFVRQHSAAEQYQAFFERIGPKLQTVHVATTSPPEVLRVVDRCTRGESRANVQVGVQQFYVAVEEEYKMETLRDLLALIPGRSAIVFCRNKRRAEWVAERLKDAACLDAGAPPADRERADAELRRGGVLVTTDVGLCEPQRVAAVFSFDIDDGRYLRRARHLRPDRAIAVAFVMPTEMDRLADHQQCCTVCELPKDFASIL